MGKRALQKYLGQLGKEDLQEQLLDLYHRFPVVKTYYDFVFDPKEDQLVQEAKAKISNEYFPVRRKRPKARRSVAQKYIKHFRTLGMDPMLLADVMCYNLEVAQTIAMDRRVPDAFYKSMLNSFKELLQHIAYHKLLGDYRSRALKIMAHIEVQKWPLENQFQRAMEILER